MGIKEGIILQFSVDGGTNWGAWTNNGYAPRIMQVNPIAEENDDGAEETIAYEITIQQRGKDCQLSPAAHEYPWRFYAPTSAGSYYHLNLGIRPFKVSKEKKQLSHPKIDLTGDPRQERITYTLEITFLIKKSDWYIYSESNWQLLIQN